MQPYISAAVRVMTPIPNHHRMWSVSCEYNLNEPDGSTYKVKRLIIPVTRDHRDEVISQTLVDLLLYSDMVDRQLAPLDVNFYKDIEAKVLIYSPPVTPTPVVPVENPLMQTLSSCQNQIDTWKGAVTDLNSALVQEREDKTVILRELKKTQEQLQRTQAQVAAIINSLQQLTG